MVLEGKKWPNQLAIRSFAGLNTWVRMAGTTNHFHIPNSRGHRALCSFKLPVPDDREIVAKPRTWERCITCQREKIRRESLS